MSETREKRLVEFIESYWTGGEYGSDYHWNDNHGELVRCRDCKHEETCCRRRTDNPDWFCADGKRKEEK